MSTSDRRTKRAPSGQNWFLSRLPKRESGRFAQQLDELSLHAGQVLFEPGRPMLHVYFPETAVISVLCCPQGDPALEVAIIGCEGLAGAERLREALAPISRFVIQQDGTARRARREAMHELLERSPAARQLAARVSYAIVDQVMLRAACNADHSPRERCARWLLMAHDRVAGDEFVVTQETLGYMLGMTRQTVSSVASQLQELGTIAYRRGRVLIRDREQLERQACSCYAAITNRTRELLS